MLTAFFSWFGKHEETTAGKAKAKLDSTIESLNSLRDQNNELYARIEKMEEDAKNMERDTRAIQAEAYLKQDRARLALSMAMSHLVLLTSHINQRQPPPAPPIPAALDGYIQALLQWSQEIPVPGQHEGVDPNKGPPGK